MLFHLEKQAGQNIRDENARQVAVAVPPSQLAFEDGKKRLIFVPGEATYAQSAHERDRMTYGIIRGSLEHMERLINPARKFHGDNVEALVHTYESPFEKDDERTGHYRAKEGIHPIPTHEGRRLGRSVMQLLQKEGEHLSLDTIDTEELKYRLSHLTLVGYSLGSVVAQNLTDFLAFEMARAYRDGKPRWSDEQIRDILKELVVVDVANISRMDYPHPRPTSYYFCGQNDGIATKAVADNLGKSDEQMALCGYGVAHAYASTEKVRPKPLSRVVGESVNVTGYMCTGSIPTKAIIPEFSEQDAPLCVMHDVEAELAKKPNPQPHDRNMLMHDLRMYLYANRGMAHCIRDVMNHAVSREYNPEKKTAVGDGASLMHRYPGATDECHISTDEAVVLPKSMGIG